MRAIFELRMWLAELLMNVGAWIQPEYRSRTWVSEDGKTITYWRESA